MDASSMAKKKKKLRREDFMFKKKTDEVLTKLPGSIDGQQFVMADLVGCRVEILDVCAAVTADRCERTEFIIGAIEGSLFLRNCVDCTVTVATGQLRTRDCTDCHIYLFAGSDPIIEASSRMVFHAFNGAYPGLPAHMAAAGLEPEINKWTAVYDFTKDDDTIDGPHFTVLAAPADDPDWAMAPLLLPGSDAVPESDVLLPSGESYVYQPGTGTVAGGGSAVVAAECASSAEPEPESSDLPESAEPAASSLGSGFGAAAVDDGQEPSGLGGSTTAVARKDAERREFLAAQSAREAENKRDSRAAAKAAITALQQEREAMIGATHERNVSTAGAMGVGSGGVGSGWAGVCDAALDSAPKGPARMRSLLISLKSTPPAGQPGPSLT